MIYVPSFEEVLEVSRSHGKGSLNPDAWNDLVGQWTGLQGGGKQWLDISGYGNYGVLTNFVDIRAAWVLGDPRAGGGALELDGSDDEVTLLQIPNISVPYSVVCWFTAANISGVKTLWALAGGSTTFQRLFLFDDDVGAQSQGAGSGFARTITNPFTANTWHMATGVWQSSTDRRAYLDGGNENINTSSSTINSPTRSDIAANHGNSSTFERHNGLIGSVAIYDRALTAEEIQAQFQSPNDHLRLAPEVFPVAVAAGNRRRRMILFGTGA